MQDINRDTGTVTGHMESSGKKRSTNLQLHWQSMKRLKTKPSKMYHGSKCVVKDLRW